MDSLTIGQIQIGDYVDITFGKGVILHNYIIKIKPKIIKIVQTDDKQKVRHLVNVNNVWIIKHSDGCHIVTFKKSDNDIQYLERDFTQPFKIIPIAKYECYHLRSNDNFTELSNGIIFYQLDFHLGTFAFFDPKNTKTFENIPLFAINYSHQIINLENAIFIYRSETKTIMKFNPNDFTSTEYDRNPQNHNIYPLKNNKILCVLADANMYILNIVENTKVFINFSQMGAVGYPIIHQLSTEDLILEYTIIKNGIYYHELCRIDIYGGSWIIVDSNINIKIISVLKDDTILLLNLDEHEHVDIVQIGEIESIDKDRDKDKDKDKDKDNTNTYRLIIKESVHLTPDVNITHASIATAYLMSSELLQNGDVLFNLIQGFYLFNYANKQIIKLFSFSINTEHYFRELRNGNILITNEEDLSILEFPIKQSVIDRKAYDNIKPLILPPEMLALIRTYL